MTKPKKPKFEMSEEQKRLFDALTPLRQEIALNSISGMNDIDSYKNSRGKAKTVKAMEASVCEILGSLKVKAFLDSMKAEAVNSAVMSRERMMEIQTAIADVSDGEMSAMSLGTLTEYKDGFNVKLKAMKQLALLGGYDAAAKHDHVSSDGSMSPKGKTLDDFYLESSSEDQCIS